MFNSMEKGILSLAEDNSNLIRITEFISKKEGPLLVAQVNNYTAEFYFLGEFKLLDSQRLTIGADCDLRNIYYKLTQNHSLLRASMNCAIVDQDYNFHKLWFHI